MLRRRSDGYHDIVTVFEKIDLCDRLTFDLSDKGLEVTTNTSELSCDEKNLVFKASSLLMDTYGIEKGARIHIDKRIPIAAGLGGGSSNAATALLGLCRLWNITIKYEELIELGKKMGADVPFFISNNAYAIGRGRGDDIMALESSLAIWHLIIYSSIKVLTKDIYKEATLNLTAKKPDVRILLRAIEQGDLHGLKTHLYNSLEPIVAKKVADIGRIKKFIKNEGYNGMMVTGSGPTIFVLTLNRKEAEGLKDKVDDFLASELGKDDWKIFVAKTIEQHKQPGI
ncbi:MAG: 4-(cytidine 5'-diphospho)-2-C-methyl-D-erythritol kinase [Candidatus Omnitrophica bacterium]|nr:4-(cytidine 5'-diphospho)-2-C-methyl-D-erythritol kinase [Candidatus Omnitrophota bacterium]